MPTEEQVRQWMRDERSQIKQEEQDACEHAFRGTLHKDGSVTCDQCGKHLVYER